MRITAWWKDRIGRHERRLDESERLRDAQRYGRDLARGWLAGPNSLVRPLTPGAGGSLVSAAFRHGLIEGDSLGDAADVAHAVLSGMSNAARQASGRSRGRRHAAEASRRVTAQRGVAWMADQVLQNAGGDFRLGMVTLEKVRRWSLEAPFSAQHGVQPAVAGR
jgi:hypothetical protein